MTKIAHYLQEHLSGEVMSGTEARAYFATDGSILSIVPAIIVYPRNENDIRKTARFTWQLAERGRVVPITARGSGTDQAGAALGSGIIMVFPAHMHRILDFDGKTGAVTVEPGINYGKLQQALHIHHRFLPPYPASLEYSTIGGAIGNNAAGEKSIKYGATRDYVRSVRVVLANGEVIETKRLSKRELNRKLGLATFEGEIYRSLDVLIDENQSTIQSMTRAVSKNSAGYALDQIKRKDGSFDLAPLFVGCQGTLGIISEAVLETEAYNSQTTLIAAYFDDLQVAEQVLLELQKLPELPSAVEMVDENLLKLVHQQNPNLLKGVFDTSFPKLVLLIEFDSSRDRTQKRMAKRVEKTLAHYQVSHQVETNEAKQEELWKIRQAAALVAAWSDNGAKALPMIEDGVIPLEKFKEYVESVYLLFERLGVEAAAWGHAGSGNLHIQPFLNLAQVGDRQKVFRLLEDYYDLVIRLGGSISGEHGDGRVRAPYLAKMYGPEVYGLFEKVKQIFDPYDTLNPGVKLGTTTEDIKPLLRASYGIEHLLQHLPRT
ncbi:FAD-binding oxidoreductase [Candidatus Saccharibacteria bacterium]|nr:FAD-binding oxidoreductase [Candidatus Saccharibacteria bacterium]